MIDLMVFRMGGVKIGGNFRASYVGHHVKKYCWHHRLYFVIGVGLGLKENLLSAPAKLNVVFRFHRIMGGVGQC